MPLLSGRLSYQPKTSAMHKHFTAALLLLILILPSAFAQVEPEAGTWKTWVIPSGKAYRLPAPKKESKAELALVRRQQQESDTATARQVQYWNAGAPGYRWDELVNSIGNLTNGTRLSSLVHTAIYDATVAAWNTKYHYNRPRPAKLDPSLLRLHRLPESPSYPCEYSVAAGAAAAVIGYMFPEKADSVLRLAEQCGASRIAAGVAFPEDVAAGLELGRQVASKVIDRARTDRFDAECTTQFLKGTGKWYAEKPICPMRGTWKTWVLDSGSQYRPGPPPDYAKAMEELKSFKPTLRTNANAYYWASVDYWTEILNRKLFEYGLHENAPRAARIYALTSIAAHDASIACFDAKYTYLALRPDQYDTTYVSLFRRSPAHPSYPSGHATVSSALASVMSYFFPYEAALFRQKAFEAGESRFEGGIHFRFDNEVGIELGRKVGDLVVRRAQEDKADLAIRPAEK